MPFVIDNAIVCGWFIQTQASKYGAAYLELALRLQMPLATADGSLREAALASGVGLFDPT